MSKKLLFNIVVESEQQGHYEQIVMGYPIQIEDDGLCEEHSSSIINIIGDGVGKAIKLDDGSIVYEIKIYASNSPFVWGKGGRK